MDSKSSRSDSLLTLMLAAVLPTLGCGSPTSSPPQGQDTEPPPATIQYALESVVSNLTAPVDLQAPPDGTDRLFVVEQAGMVRVIQGGVLVATPFLDIRDQVTSGGERGLLGLAFHPDYSQNRRFFLSYTRTTNDQLESVIAEYQTSVADPNTAETAETVLLTVDQPSVVHNGGQIQFGTDGYLYISLGDGGSSSNGQKMDTLLGKILRIDVDTQPYAIPLDNPFVSDAGARGEIWALGFRNPWRFSIDRLTGRLYAGDVGQSSYEEVDLVAGGGNYGWNIMEGAHCYPPPSTDCSTAGLGLPITEYGRDKGTTVTGGYVYRGALMPELQGSYIFGDFGSGRIWRLQQTSQGVWTRSELLDTELNISSFGQDEAGEIYANDYSGTVYRLRQAM